MGEESSVKLYRTLFFLCAYKDTDISLCDISSVDSGYSIKKHNSDRTNRHVRFFRTFALDELEEKSLEASLHQTQIRSLLS